MNYNLLLIMGATASGKTSVAAHWAYKNEGEVISADSRQVYKGMTIGTGKDYADYIIDGQTVATHCIDIVQAGEQYNVYEYQKDFLKAYKDVIARKKRAVLCGGSGMYIEAVIDGYTLINTPINNDLRNELDTKTDQELTDMLASLKKVHNVSDSDTRKRTIRAIEIALHQSENKQFEYPTINPLIVGIQYDRQTRRQRITERLRERLNQGMIEEVKGLMQQGLSVEQLEYYGLEYKFIAYYLSDKLTYNQMFDQLNVAIHQFAKRQMTWLRRMERNGRTICWLDGSMPLQEKLNKIDSLYFG